MATLGDLIEGLPNDLKEIIDKKMMVDLSTRAQNIKARTMPVPELNTAMPKKTGSAWVWPYIDFEYEGEVYSLHMNTTGDNQGFSLNRVLPNFSHIIFFDPVQLTLIVPHEQDVKILPLVQALLTVVRRYVPSATPQNITVQYGRPADGETVLRISLTEFMNRINLSAIDGGAKRSKVKFEGRVYKLHTNKAKGDYIMVSKDRIYLKDIRRRYRFSH
jgi:hypothetical protein